LTTQLQNQDPLDPMDSNEFTRQLVEFSGVEQAIHTNKNLESLISLIAAGATSSAVSYLGKEATAGTSTAHLANGEATWNYTLPKDSATTIATITNSVGRVVYVGPVSGTLGANTFTWDGNDNHGNALPEGNYTVNITARDAEGVSIAPTVSIKGIVTSVEFENGVPVISIGGARVPLSAVTSVSTPQSGV
jgi:flagellar basal-body rod modification protein FlgD